MHGTESDSHESPSLTRVSQAAKRTGFSRSHLYDLSKRGEFPPIIKIGERASGVVTSELDAWIRDRIKAARAVRENPVSRPSSSDAA